MATVSQPRSSERRPRTAASQVESQRATPLEGRRATPVKWWALLGALFLALFAYTWLRWLMSGPQATPNGITPQPGWQVAFLHVLEGVSWVTFLLVLYFVTIRPWRREGRPTSYGLLVLAGLGAYWQDLGFSYFKIGMTYNTHFVNFGSWFEYIPGWISPNANSVPEPLLWNWPLFGVYFLIGGVMGCYIMRKAKARWPLMGPVGLSLLAWVGVFFIELVVESLWLRTTAYSYVGDMGPTLFKGHYYQVPLILIFFFSLMWAAWGPFFYFRDDKGYTVVERGIDRVRATPRQKILLRVLALCAAANIIYGSFNVAFGQVVAHAGRWSEDVINRSYLNDGLCGPGTTSPCPDGKLTVLPGTRVPAQR